MRAIYEVVPSGAKWVLREQGGKRRRVFETRAEAIAKGRSVCKANAPSRLRVRKTQPRRAEG